MRGSKHEYKRNHCNDGSTLPSRLRPFPIAIDHGEGATLYDADGKAYIDFLAGIATNALGYHYPAIVKAVCEQTQKVMHTSNLFYTEIQAKAAQQLAEVTGMDRVFLPIVGPKPMKESSSLPANMAAVRTRQNFASLRQRILFTAAPWKR